MNKKIVLLSIFVLAIGIIIGFIGEKMFYLDKIEFVLNGNEEYNVAINSDYIEQGVSFKINDVDYSEDVVIEYYYNSSKVDNIDTSVVNTYYALYKVDHNDYSMTKTRKINIVESDSLEIHFLELGNKYTGDSIYIKSGENDILIDAGSKTSSGDTIVNYLNNYVTDNKLEYVFTTHAHEDHYAAMPQIFRTFEVDYTIDFSYEPTDSDWQGTEKTYKKGGNDQFSKYVDARIENGCTHYSAYECYNNLNGATRTIDIGLNIELEILNNYYYNASCSSENDHSVCFTIKQLDNYYLFTGDLEAEGEELLVTNNNLPDCVFYKAGHHGSKTSSSLELLEVIKPEIVVVTCCAGTSEYTDEPNNQFPTQQFIDRISKYTDKIYVTSVVDTHNEAMDFSSMTVKSMNGNITLKSQGTNIDVLCSGSDLILKESDWFKENRVWPD